MPRRRRLDNWRKIWLNERGALVVLSIMSLVFIAIYSSASTPWLEHNWSPGPNEKRHRVQVYDPFFQGLLPDEVENSLPSVQWSITLWNYCVSTTVEGRGEPTESCYAWKDVCTTHKSDVCMQLATMQSLSFLSVLLSMMALYAAYRALDETSGFMPLWSMSCRVLQIAFETGLILLAYDLVNARPTFPEGMLISSGALVCATHTCVSLLGFIGAIFVFLRSEPELEPTFILFSNELANPC
ncbi:hypothetical protein AC1031_019803 [Aphanomyces cochlioides]|nr:hypothetical protein AC1031_019803 [Aphanomyces cochlioides]